MSKKVGSSPTKPEKGSFQRHQKPSLFKQPPAAMSLCEVKVGVLMKRLERNTNSWKNAPTTFTQSHYRTKPRKLTASSLSPQCPHLRQLDGLCEYISSEIRRNDSELHHFNNEHTSTAMELGSLERDLSAVQLEIKHSSKFSQNSWMSKLKERSVGRVAVESPEPNSKHKENLISSVGHEGNSLLLSFKKNMEDDEDLMTLKYS